MRALLPIVLILAVPMSGAGQQRLASDYEIATAERALAAASSPMRRVAALLNVGDLRASRLELEASRERYGEAETVASGAARSARVHSDLEAFATAMAYRGLARAKLGDPVSSFADFEEALRYQSDSPRTWNLYASAMTILGMPGKAEAGARNAVALASVRNETPEALLDLSIYRYALASALLATDPASAEAGELLRSIVEALDSPQFDFLRERIARQERFEVFSSVRRDEEAWLSLRNRSLLRLAGLREERGEIASARATYERVLDSRSDDVHALAGLARLAGAADDRERWFADSFAANPFSASLILQYEEHLAGDAAEPGAGGGESAMQRALWLLSRERHAEALEAVATIGERRSAAVSYVRGRAALAAGEIDRAEALAASLPPSLRNRLVQRLALARDAREGAGRLLEDSGAWPEEPAAAWLRDLAAALRDPSIDPALLAALDATLFTSLAVLDPPTDTRPGVTVLESGSIHGIPFRFSVPTAFHGDIAAGESRMTYRIEGASGQTLLVAPVRIDPR
ncbi:MAG TPA: hypothetical protein VMS56_00910 [Thermoanaerobaculia bacterium]|nr:hypothetical protein [Thermoanaerobaculia bacterium]